MKNAPPPAAPPGSENPDGADPSMEEILASIRRILNEEDAPAPGEQDTAEPAADEDVLILDETMMVAPPEAPPEVPHPAPAPDVFDTEPGPVEPAAVEPAAVEAASVVEPVVIAKSPVVEPVAVVRPSIFQPQADLPRPEMEIRTPTPPDDRAEQPEPVPDLLGPEAAAAAAFSVGNLVRTLSAGRTTQVFGGGPTLEDMVRAELRPLLKGWLDKYLPPMVERLVRAEIERVVGRYLP